MQAVFSCRDILHITTGLPLRPLNSETFSQKFLVKICIETVLAVQVSLAFFVIDTGIFFSFVEKRSEAGEQMFRFFSDKICHPPVVDYTLHFKFIFATPVIDFS